MPEKFAVFEWAPGLILDTPPLDDDDEWNIVEYDDDIFLDPMHEPSSDHHIIPMRNLLGKTMITVIINVMNPSCLSSKMKSKT